MIKALVDGIIYGRQAGGISRCFTELLTRASEEEDLRLLLHLPARCLAPPPAARRLSIVRDPSWRPGRVFLRLNRARLRLWRPRIFHSTYYTPPYWRGCKNVVTVYDFTHERFPDLLENPAFVESKRRAIEGADCILAVSEATKADALRFARAPQERIRVIPLGVGAPFTDPPPTKAERTAFMEAHRLRPPCWLYVGRRVRYKNFLLALDAFARLREKTGGTLLVAGGPAEFEPAHLETLKRRLPPDAVRLLSPADDSALRMAYATATAFLFPSLWEGFGLPLLEAMACGCPTVASDIPVFREVAGDAALYFDPQDAAALAESMAALLKEDVRQACVARGRERVKRFSWDRAAQQLAQAYRALM